MGQPANLFRCSLCETEKASEADSYDCPECGTAMRKSPNTKGIYPNPNDPRNARPKTNRLPPPTSRQRPPI